MRSKPDERVKAKAYKESMLKYETNLTAKIYLRIFELKTPLLKYLQTSGMDFLNAHQMVSTTLGESGYIIDFDAVKKADNFVVWANSHLQKLGRL